MNKVLFPCEASVDCSSVCTSRQAFPYEIVGGIATVKTKLCLWHVNEIQKQHPSWQFNNLEKK